ncbi:MAG: metallophosphoesterase [Oscillospiraceae bacterium]|nr:metallophosphoesterase [Oscillospiraceae bacterium]
MRALIVSDVTSAYIWDHFDRRNFEGVEVVLSCGDLPASYLEFIVTLLNVPLLYVPGNHDKSFRTAPPQGCVDMDGQFARVCGKRVFGLGGCRSPHRDIHQYTEKDMARRVKRLTPLIKRKGIDILMTHAPAFGLGDGKDLFHQGFECFRELLERFEPCYHIFGHQHKSYSHEKPPEQAGATRLINASGHRIVDLRCFGP